MAVNEYKLPDVGEGLTEAEIVQWRVKVGDVIKVNDVVVDIETAKSVVELPSPYAGTVLSILVPEGETVAVGTPIITVGDPADAAGTAQSAPAAPAQAKPEDAEDGAGENKTLVGYGPRTGSVVRRPRRGPATPSTDAGSATQMQVQGTFSLAQQGAAEVVPTEEPPVPAVGAEHGDLERQAPQAVGAGHRPARPAVAAQADAEDDAGAVRPGQAWSVGPVLAKPPVRKRAKELGVDLRSLTPSGPNGTVTVADVEAAAGLAGQPSVAVTAEAVTGPAAQPAGLTDRREPIKGVRKMMGQAMVQSAFTIPHVTEWVTVDATRTMRLVDSLKADPEFRDVRVSPLLLLARAVTLAMRRTPEVNAHWDDEAQEVVFSASVNLGIAAATPRGLVVPNIKDAQARTLAELAAELNQLTSRAREGGTQPAEMAGGTFTITNVGVFGIDSGTPIINPGESAILAFGAVRRQPWVHRGKVKPRHVTTLALSFDHRFIDGAKGSRFLADVAGLLEDPTRAVRY